MYERECACYIQLDIEKSKNVENSWIIAGLSSDILYLKHVLINIQFEEILNGRPANIVELEWSIARVLPLYF